MSTAIKSIHDTCGPCLQGTHYLCLGNTPCICWCQNSPAVPTEAPKAQERFGANWSDTGTDPLPVAAPQAESAEQVCPMCCKPVFDEELPKLMAERDALRSADVKRAQDITRLTIAKDSAEAEVVRLKEQLRRADLEIEALNREIEAVAAQPPQPPEDFVKVNPSTYGNLVAIWQTALMLFSGPPDELPDVEAMRRRMHEAAQPPKEQGE